MERAALRRLGIFGGTFSLRAARAVAAGEQLTASEVADCIASLVAKSLVMADLGGSIVLYRLFEATRVYAREKLAESGELERVARRRAEYDQGLFDDAGADRETKSTIEGFGRYLASSASFA
jgi:predicted ATPase